MKEKKKMVYDMEKVNLAMLMEEYMKEIGNMEQWMVMENYFIQTENLHMKDNGKIMHLMERVKSEMKILNPFKEFLIIWISICLGNIGNIMKGILLMILNKVKDHWFS